LITVANGTKRRNLKIRSRIIVASQNIASHAGYPDIRFRTVTTKRGDFVSHVAESDITSLVTLVITSDQPRGETV